MTSPTWRDVRSAKKTGVGKFLDEFQTRMNRDHPERSLIEDLVGEALQNSLDARVEPSPVEIEFEVIDKTDDAWKSLRGKNGSPRVLRISNRNARGLDGAISNGPPLGDYQKFMGFDSDSAKPRGGGSYGYGRSTYFIASKSNRVLVDTVFVDSNNRPVRRLVGVRFIDTVELANANSSTAVGEHYCDGVSVWGVNDPKGEIRPLEEDASHTSGVISHLAQSMGLHRKPGNITPGTDIYVIDLRDDDELTRPRAKASIGSQIQGALLWRLWPALMDGEVVVAVKENGKRTEVVVNEDDIGLWPLLAFTQLRRKSKENDAHDKINLGGRYLSSFTSEGKVIAASREISSLKAVVDPRLKCAYPGNIFWGEESRTEGIVAVVRFRANKLVVNYDGSVPYRGVGTQVLKAPASSATWRIGLLEVTDPDISDQIRVGADAPRGRKKVEDVSHTKWEFSRAMAKFEAVAEGFMDLAKNIGVRRDETGVPGDQTGSDYWTRRLGSLLQTGSGAPARGVANRRAPNGGGGRGKKKNGTIQLRAGQPACLNETDCFVFSAEDLIGGITYRFAAKIQTVSGLEELPEIQWWVLDKTGCVSKSKDEFYTHADGQRIAVEIPSNEQIAMRLYAQKASRISEVAG